MAVYFITSIQLTKLIASKQLERKRLQLVYTEIDDSEWRKMFGSEETVAYNSHYELAPFDQLILGKTQLIEVAKAGNNGQ